MKYLMLFWVDESAETTANVEVRSYWDAPWDH